MSELNHNNFEILAQHFNSCGRFRERLKNCVSINDLVQLINGWEESIADHLKDPAEVVVEVEAELDVEKVASWLASNRIYPYDQEAICTAIGLDGIMDRDVYALAKNSMINTMKIDLLMDMIHDVSLADLEALHAKYRSGSVAVNQLSLAV